MTQPVVYQLLPELSEEEYEALKADIAAKGIQVPIEVDEEGNVLDGYHRLRAARELGIPEEAIPKVVRAGLTEQEKREHVLRLNLLRRQLSREQKRAIALELRREGWTQTRIAQLLGVAQATVHSWLQEVAEQDGQSALPEVIVDSLGRRQAASKPRRRFDWPEAPDPSSAEGLAEGEVHGQEEPSAEELAPPVSPEDTEIDPEAAEQQDEDRFDAAGAAEDGTFAVEGEAETVEGDTLPFEDDTGAVETPTEGDAEAAGDVIKTDNAEPEPEPEPEPEAEAEEEPVSPPSSPSWTYFWRCQPAPFPGPVGRLTDEEYEMAVAFEAALNVLHFTYQQDGRGRKVLRSWRRWKAEQGQEQAPHQASRLLEAIARYIRTTLALSRRSGGRRREGGEEA